LGNGALLVNQSTFMAHLYLSLTPESLVASMLEPADFGRYLAISPSRKTSSPAIFFALDIDPVLDAFGVRDEFEKCVPHPDGTPRRSTYLAIYRVLERVPMSAFRSLYLTTKDGLVLELKGELSAKKEGEERFHLYQELSPLTPRVVSRLSPSAFGEYLTSGGHVLSVPRIVFADMKLGPLATDPGHPSSHNLPYSRLDHLRDCLNVLRKDEGKPSKVLNRDFHIDDLYYNIESGFYLSGEGKTLFYRMPDEEELTEHNNAWRKSAESSSQVL
jgi:hypothetical protein